MPSLAYAVMEQQFLSRGLTHFIDILKSHKHAETDSQIPLHSLFSFEYKTLNHIALNFDIDSMDTDSLALLLDLATHRDGPIEPSTIIIINTGRGRMGKAEVII